MSASPPNRVTDTAADRVASLLAGRPRWVWNATHVFLNATGVVEDKGVSACVCVYAPMGGMKSEYGVERRAPALKALWPSAKVQ